MRFLPLFLSSLTLIPFAKAFPTLFASQDAIPGPDLDSPALIGLRETITRLQRRADPDGPPDRRRNGRLPTEPVSVTGAHAFAPPDYAAGDQRGPCPGLNALANHGYLPRSGIATLSEALAAVQDVYNMGPDLALVLVGLAVAFTGDPLSANPSFSIGGVDARVTGGSLLPSFLVGTPRGLDGSHNFIETDGSLTRDDLYVTGNAWDMNMTKFLQVYRWPGSGEGGALTFDDVGDISAMRWKEAEITNPWFWYGPLTGYLPRTGGFALTARTLSNYTMGEAEGQLTKNMLKSFWAVTDDAGAESGLIYRRGWERMPENWYSRPTPWGLVDLGLDVLSWGARYPYLLDIGGNTGKVNTFTGLDLSNLTGGVLNAETLLEGNNLICFTLEIAKTLGPNSLSTIYKGLALPLELVTNVLGTSLLALSCPVFEDLASNGNDIWASILATYPGARRSGSSL